MPSTNGLVAITQKDGTIYCWTMDDDKVREMIKLTRAVLGEPLLVAGDKE